MVHVEELERKMKDKNISIVALAKKSGVDKSVISRLLSGETKSCSVGTAHKLSEALNLTGKESANIFLK